MYLIAGDQMPWLRSKATDTDFSLVKTRGVAMPELEELKKCNPLWSPKENREYC